MHADLFPGVCEYLVDDDESVIKVLVNLIDLNMLMRDIVAERWMVRVHIRSTSSTKGQSHDLRYTYWLHDFLAHFGNVLKKAGIYDAVWTSQLNMLMEGELLEAFTTSWCLHTNTLHTCYDEYFSLEYFPNFSLSFVGKCMISFSTTASSSGLKLFHSLRLILEVGKRFDGHKSLKYTK